MTAVPEVAVARRAAFFQEALEQIVEKLPACSAEAETAWENRQWAGHFRDLQQIARRALRDAPEPA